MWTRAAILWTFLVIGFFLQYSDASVVTTFATTITTASTITPTKEVSTTHNLKPLTDETTTTPGGKSTVNPTTVISSTQVVSSTSTATSEKSSTYTTTLNTTTRETPQVQTTSTSPDHSTKHTPDPAITTSPLNSPTSTRDNIMTTKSTETSTNFKDNLLQTTNTEDNKTVNPTSVSTFIGGHSSQSKPTEDDKTSVAPSAKSTVNPITESTSNKNQFLSTHATTIPHETDDKSTIVLLNKPPADLTTVTSSTQVVYTSSVSHTSTSAPPKTEYALTKKITWNETQKETDNNFVKTCRLLLQNFSLPADCSFNHTTGPDEKIISVALHVDASLAQKIYNQIENENPDPTPLPSTIPTTLIAILSSCGALVFIFACFATYCIFHHRSYRKNQQHLTEELQTVENGYHDNPTLEVMEVQPEMQEKKMALNGEFNDSWIVPMDNLAKEDLPDEEDTHL
ncbi:podocalyxin isoform X1 [Hoplias malabaricus]|uniref:podocalyxin isoform X1 n=1 Tax=Hoplias malabaricus TaxID=27720 RepID=UPI0034633A12